MKPPAHGTETVRVSRGTRRTLGGARRAPWLGHFFNVVNDNGTIRSLDGQSGGVANLNNGYVKLYILRTD